MEEEQHTRARRNEDAGTLVAPSFLGKYKNEQPSVCVFVCARTDSNKIWGYTFSSVLPC